MAKRPPVPDYNPTRAEDIAVFGGLANGERIATFDGAPWASWLPMRGERRMLSVKCPP